MLQLHVPCVLFGMRLRRSSLAARIASNLDFSPAVYKYVYKIIGATPGSISSPEPSASQGMVVERGLLKPV